MNFGIITDAGTSNYWNKYPHLREAQVWIKALVRDGHRAHLLAPDFTPAMWRKFHGDQKNKFQEWFQDRIGMLPVLDGTDVEIDQLIVVGAPWLHAFNYQGMDVIKKYANKVDSIVWMVFDYEMYSPQKSVLYDLLPEDIRKKVRLVITTDPTLKSKIDIPHVWMPHLYDPEYEIPIQEKTEICRFVGPIGFRKKIGDSLDVLNSIGEHLGIRSSFYGEKAAAKYRDSQVDLSGKSFKSIDVKQERVFLPYPEYLKFISNSWVTFHDSYPPTWLTGKSDIALWSSGKVSDASYAGVYVISSPWMNCEGIECCTKLGERTLTSILGEVMNWGNHEYANRIKLFRESMNRKHGISTWYPQIKQWLGV